MFPPTNVSFSGPAFSFLLYETCKSRVCQEGFLLGEIVHKETTSITDNDQQQVNVSKLIKINSVVPCPENYFRMGHVDGDKVKKFLGDQINDVVAWYKFQNFDTFKFTLKNRLVHNQLKELFKVPPDLFTCCLLVTESTNMLSTYIHSQIFIRYHEGHIDRLGMQIPNLSEPNNTYRNCEPASKVFNEILSNLKGNIKNTRGVVAVSEIEKAVQTHINGTVEKLSTAEKKLFKLEDDVRILKSRLQALEPNNYDNRKSLAESNNDNSLMEAEDTIENYLGNNKRLSHEIVKDHVVRKQSSGLMEADNTIENDSGDNKRLPHEVVKDHVVIRKQSRDRMDNGDIDGSTNKVLTNKDKSNDDDPDITHSPVLNRRPSKTGRPKKNDNLDSKSLGSDQEMKIESTRGGRGRETW